MIKIDKNIPLPPKGEFKYRAGRPKKYPFGDMQVGDSLFQPKNKKGEYQLSLVNAAFKFGKEHGLKFASRRMPEGIRVWRIE